MPRWLWVLLTFIISSGIYLAVRYGLRPKPVAMINPTVISAPNEMGALVYQRIRETVRTEKILFFGYTDVKFFSAPFSGFIKTALVDGLKIKTVIEVTDGVSSSELKNNFFASANVNIAWINVPTEKLMQSLQEQMSRNMPVVVIVPAEQATHLERAGLVKQMESQLKSPIMAINFLPFYVSEEELGDNPPNCDKPKHEMIAKEKLGCATYKISRKFLRKKLDPNKLFVALEWHGLKEYLAYLHSPVTIP